MASNKTEKATPKRRTDARRKGQVARRPELSAAVGFLAALLMLRMLSDHLMHHAADLLKDSFTHFDPSGSLTASAVQDLVLKAGSNLALLSLPVIGAALVAGIAINFAQGGLTLSVETLKPKIEKFNPVSNLKRTFSSNGPIELLKSVLKLCGIGLIGYGIFGRAVLDAPTFVGATASQTLATLGTLIYSLSLRAGGVLFLIAAMDYGYGWYKHEKSLRMTKQEVKDEYRQQEGDPFVKGQRRRSARAISQKRIAAEVPRADVVVTNPTHFAVALRYDRKKDAAPIVVAKGADEMAKRIRQIARAHNVAVVENPPLARTLYRTVEMGRSIPPDLFRAVAELLAYVYRQREHGATSH